MLGLPESTKVNKILYKNKLFEYMKLKTSEKEKFNQDIKKIRICNEISSRTINIPEGNEVKSFFFIEVELNNQDYNKDNIIILNKFIPQNIVFVITYEDKIKLAVFRQKFFEGEWLDSDFKLKLNGLDIESIYENIIVNIGKINISEEKSLDEQIKIDEEVEKINKKIEQLKRKMYREKQPRKKFELKREIDSLEIKRRI